MYSEAITNLQAASTIQNPGVCSVLFTPIENLSNNYLSWPEIYKLLNSGTQVLNFPGISIFASSVWYTVHKDISSELSISPEHVDAGIQHKCVLPIQIPNDDPALANLMRSMHRRQFIVLVKQSNGSWRLLGLKERGADFAWDYSSGQRSQPNKYSCAFSWVSAEPPMHVVA